MQNKKSKVKKVALTLALAQLMTVTSTLPLNLISNNTKVYAAKTQEIYKFKKYTVGQKEVTVQTGEPTMEYFSTTIYRESEPDIDGKTYTQTFYRNLDWYGNGSKPKTVFYGYRDQPEGVTVGDTFDVAYTVSNPVFNKETGTIDVTINESVYDPDGYDNYRGYMLVDNNKTAIFKMAGDSNGGIYSDATTLGVEGFYYVKTPTEKKLVPTKGTFVEDITATDKSAYPENGEKDGFWYELVGTETITVEEEADTFEAEIQNISVRKGDTVDLTTAITNLPEGATVEIKTPVDTSTAGEKEGVVTVKFSDNSTKDITIPVKVKDWVDIGVITPIEEIKSEDIQKEIVKRNGTINLLDNINNLPESATVEDVTTPVIDTSVAKETEGKVKVTFEDGSSRIITIPVLIEALEADTFEAEIQNISVRKGDTVDLTTAITNLPEGATVEIKTPVDTSTAGEKEGVVTVKFSDNSTKDITIPVKVKDWIDMGTITPIEEIIDNIKEEVVEKGATIDITDNVIAKNAKSFEDVTTPEIDTSTAGQYIGKVKVTFEDGSSRIVNIPVIVLENTKELTDKIAELEKDKETLEAEKAKLEEDKDSLNKQIEDLNAKIAEKEKELENLKDTTDADKAKLQEEIDNLKKQIEDLNAKIAEKDEEIAELKDKIAELEKDKETLEAEKAKLQEEIDKLNKEIEELKKSEEDNTDKIKELEDKVTELEAKDIINQDEIDKLNKEIEALKEQLQDAINEKENLEKENNELKDKIKELQDLLNGVVDSNKNKDQKIKELEEEIDNLKKQIKELEAKKDTTDTDKAKLQEEIDNLKKQIKELENKKDTTDSSNEDPNKDLKDKLEKLIAKAERELDRNRDLTKEQKRKLEDAIDNANDVLKDSKSDRADYREAIRELEDLLEQITNPETAKEEDINKKIEDYIKNNPGQKVGEEVLNKNGQYNFLKYIFKIDSNLYHQATNKSITSFLMDTTPFIQDSRTMLPLRYIAYALGAEVKWNEASRVASFTKDGLTASIQVDGNVINMSDGRKIIMDTNAVIKNSRTFVSLTNVYKVFEKDQNKIEWDSNKREVTINIVK